MLPANGPACWPRVQQVALQVLGSAVPFAQAAAGSQRAQVQAVAKIRSTADIGANGQIYSWWDSSGRWLNHDLGTGEPAASGTSPAVFGNAANENWVYYTGANG